MQRQTLNIILVENPYLIIAYSFSLLEYIQNIHFKNINISK
jgi:hypothetical protein